MLDKLYGYRFEMFFVSQIVILFGSLLIPSSFFDTLIAPLLFLINLFAGILLVSRKKHLSVALALLLIISIAIVFLEILNESDLGIWRMMVYFLFYIVVTLELINQIWQANVVDKKVILGLVSGYISLGLIAFFICLSIEVLHPNSFSGLSQSGSLTENLMYYSYITLMTIGYGDILPITALSKKAAIFIGLTGQIYLVILTAIIVGKYLNQK